MTIIQKKINISEDMVGGFEELIHSWLEFKLVQQFFYGIWNQTQGLV
jgi:hypothetical protein